VTLALLLEQLLNGFQLGLMLFLMSAGLTLTFGIMNFINLTHSSFFMMGAFFVASAFSLTSNFYLAVLLATVATTIVALAIDRLALRYLYRRSHLDQVLATFALLAFFNDAATIVYGSEPRFVPIPPSLSGSVLLPGGIQYPIYRIAIMAAALVIALGLYLIITRTRLGMWIRAGAERPEMLGGLGVNVQILFAFVFAAGSAMAGLAGMLTGPLVSIQPGMGNEMLITAFVVIVIGGIGSVRGAFISALSIGIIDTMGRVLLPQLLGFTVGPALASMTIYLVMAAVLFARPPTLFSKAQH
jgi:branched-chain amino acid transport system permease protein